MWVDLRPVCGRYCLCARGGVCSNHITFCCPPQNGARMPSVEAPTGVTRGRVSATSGDIRVWTSSVHWHYFHRVILQHEATRGRSVYQVTPEDALGKGRFSVALPFAISGEPWERPCSGHAYAHSRWIIPSQCLRCIPRRSTPGQTSRRVVNRGGQGLVPS